MEETINILDIVEIVKKHWRIVAISTLLTTILSVVFTFFMIKPQYEASTKLFIGKEENGQGYSQSDVSMYQKLIKTYSELIKTKDLAKKSILDANIDIAPNKLLSELSVTPVADTQIIEIKYRSESQKDALILLECVKDEFVKLSKELVPNGNIQELENVSGTGIPVSPNKVMNIVLGIVIGLVIGFGLIATLAILDNTFKTKQELEQIEELPVIGVIPIYEGVIHHGRKGN